MTSLSWRGVVDAVLYSVQFDDLDSSSTVQKIADTMVARPFVGVSPEEGYRALIEGLDSEDRLTASMSTEHGEAEFRWFLAAVLGRLDGMRPWAEPPFRCLPDSRFDEFANGSAIGVSNRPVWRIEQVLGRSFQRRNDSQQAFLLLRLRSGAEVGFIAPYWPETSGIAILTTSRDHAAADVLRELIEGTDLEPRQVTPLLPSADGQRGRYRTTPIQPEFVGEHLPGNARWNGSQVTYLDERERQPYRLQIRDGRLYDGRGQLFDTAAARTLWTPQGGRAIFSMDADGVLYSSPHHVLGRFHHSSFLAGAPSAGAGELAASFGVIRVISDHSTHYRPPRHITAQVIDSLRRQGVAIDDQQIEYHWPDDRR
ncbi:hypothetical protein GV794_24840 [Nocardia cyriacigeorgica]|uniref:Uncharacterized protein n=1 Tax=Nocardia cyriacigeorgica TaxID=135487 RepID=A0ABX0CQR5_9NOCA|nr:hypothetical protein [Nocardia cyriacigeorgica]NEW53682.1 hypothetical protein [Nocardia cyriacigeorgica]NEW58840.1 hypothetical protein [Nocardia cyriacigeorgica]